LYTSILYLFLHVPFSSTGPKIYLKILIWKILSSLSSDLDNGQVLEACDIIGLTSTLYYIVILVFLGINWDFRRFLKPWRRLFAESTRIFISSLILHVFWQLTSHPSKEKLCITSNLYEPISMRAGPLLCFILWRVVPLGQQPYKFWGLIYFWHQPVTSPGVRDR
jgi:hypothetical protein